VPTTLYFLIAVSIIFGFLDGLHNSANVVATVISSRAMSPRRAFTLTALAEFIGPFVLGTAVARTIGSEIIDAEFLTLAMATTAVVGAILWKVLTWLLGLPSSSSHALLGGIVGAVIAGGMASHLKEAGLTKVVLALLLSPLVGLISGYVMMIVTKALLSGASPRVNNTFRRAQTVTALLLGLSYGSSNAQKTMGILMMGLLSTGTLTRFEAPLWVIALAAVSMAMGTFVGGTRIIRTIGTGFYKIRPVHGFAAQLTSGAIILAAALSGGPVSTTQVVSSAIVGVGSAERLSKVRWTLFRDIGMAWLLTIPLSALLAGLLLTPIELLFQRIS